MAICIFFPSKLSSDRIDGNCTAADNRILWLFTSINPALWRHFPLASAEYDQTFPPSAFGGFTFELALIRDAFSLLGRGVVEPCHWPLREMNQKRGTAPLFAPHTVLH